MKHVGILAHSTEGAALCFLTFCQEGFRRLGRNEHRGCDAVALVCTEIPLQVTPKASSLPTLDSTRLLAGPPWRSPSATDPCPPGVAARPGLLRGLWGKHRTLPRPDLGASSDARPVPGP